MDIFIKFLCNLNIIFVENINKILRKLTFSKSTKLILSTISWRPSFSAMFINVGVFMFGEILIQNTQVGTTATFSGTSSSHTAIGSTSTSSKKESLELSSLKSSSFFGLSLLKLSIALKKIHWFLAPGFFSSLMDWKLYM